jgi:hypothetical protein
MNSMDSMPRPPVAARRPTVDPITTPHRDE